MRVELAGECLVKAQDPCDKAVAAAARKMVRAWSESAVEEFRDMAERTIAKLENRKKSEKGCVTLRYLCD